MSVLGRLLRQQLRSTPAVEARGGDCQGGAHGTGDPAGSRIFLYVGCGNDRGANIRHGFDSGWKEVRLDIDPTVRPDLVGTVLDMRDIPGGSIDAVYSAHTLEHLHAHEVAIALGEIKRILKPEGMAIIIVPDLQSVASAIAEDRLFATIYNSALGPITPFDLLYGHRDLIAGGNSFMAHKSGFTLSSLSDALRAAGFKSVGGLRRPEGFDLGTIATCRNTPDAELRRLIERHLPI